MLLWKIAGFTLPEILVATSISGLVAAGALELIVQSKRTSVNSENKTWIAIRRADFDRYLHSSTGWSDVLAQNPSMACLTSASGCPSITTPQPLKLPTSDGTVLDGANPGTGMTSSGLYCTTFDPNVGSDACPIGLDLKWEALCDSSACIHPQPKLTIGFKKKIPSQSLQNMPSYNLVYYRDSKLDSLNVVCASMGGTLTGTTCTIASLQSSCNPSSGQFVTGFDSSGAVICGSPNPGSCPAGQIAVGFNSDGTIACSAGCP